MDCHHHVWSLKRGDYGWLNERSGPVLYRDYIPGDLSPLLAAQNIDKTVVVQAAPTIAETQFLLGLARRNSFIGGVVGWADFEASDAPQTIARLARDGKLCGLRPMLQDLEDDSWILRREIQPAVSAMADSGLSLDILIFPRHLPHVEKFLSRHRDLRCVIDHGAKPAIARGDIEPWATRMRRIGRESAAFCKLSGLVTEAGPGWSSAKLRPYVDVLLDAFGPERLMWGSDWPVLNLAAGYGDWFAAARALTAGIDPAGRDMIFGGTAKLFYRIED